jgi:tetratricopeptide (TPR) repeat protein
MNTERPPVRGAKGDTRPGLWRRPMVRVGLAATAVLALTLAAWLVVVVRNNLNADASYSRGYQCLQTKQFDQAIVEFTSAIEWNPSYDEALVGRACAWQGQNDYDKALADCNAAIRLNPRNAFAYDNRGIAWQAKGENEKAVADLTVAIRLKPEDAPVYGNRARALAALGNYDEAIADYREAIRRDPDGASGREARARIADLEKRHKAGADVDASARPQATAPGTGAGSRTTKGNDAGR